MNISKLSLMRKLMIGINSAALILLIIFGFEIYTSNVETSISIIKSEVNNIANSIATSSLEFYIHPDEKEFNYAAQKMNEEKLIESIIFRDNNGKILAQSLSKRTNEEFNTLKKDIIDEENVKLGTVEIFFNHDDLDLVKIKTIKTVSLYILLTLLMLSLIVYFILKRVTDRLYQKSTIIKVNTEQTI